MARLEDLTHGAVVRGVRAEAPVEVVAVKWFGTSALELTFKDSLGRPLINQVLDETPAEQEGDFDSDNRFALAWFEPHGFAEGEFGVGGTLSKASVSGLAQACILESRRGRIRLLRPSELPGDWDLVTNTRLTHWETVHDLIRVLEAGGEPTAAELVKKLGSKAETARKLAYHLYAVCERKKRATEALSYNALVQNWPEIARLAPEGGQPHSSRQTPSPRGENRPA